MECLKMRYNEIYFNFLRDQHSYGKIDCILIN